MAKITAKEPDEIKPDDRLIDDLLMDSLEIIELGMNIEEQWSIIIDETQLRKLLTVADVAVLLPPGDVRNFKNA
ncbi:hypothetical protein AQ914_04450 [Burkholderia pseudomallei]|nr:hypothetical protein AQ914_04450 [Burkholderia pseudomallei]